MIQNMTSRFPGDEDVEDTCCQYFATIALLSPKVKKTLQEKKSGLFVGNSCGRLRSEDHLSNYITFHACAELMDDFLDYV